MEVSTITANRAVATTSMLFILEAIMLGMILKYAKRNKWINTAIAIVMLVAAVIGVFVANPACNLEAFIGFNVDGQYLFPILFVTIACGAVSGFHSLVSSGTASKQIKNEKGMLPVSFGAMLMESMLAVIALIAVASFGKGEAVA